MPGVYIPPPHQPASGQQQHTAMAGLYWPQGDPGQLRQAAAAWRQLAAALESSSGESAALAGQVRQNQGSGIDAFSGYWQKWQGGGGYYGQSAQAARQLAQGLDRYADAIDNARQRITEIAAAAATAVLGGLILTVFTVGISDAVAGAAAAGLAAAAEAVGVTLAATVTEIAGSILAAAALGALAGMTIDTAVQVERIEVFHDQKSFNWGEFGYSAGLGAATAGAGGALGVGVSRVAPVLGEVSPALARGAQALDALPGPIKGAALGAGMAAGTDEITTGKVNLIDVGIGGLSGGIGGAIGSSRTTTTVPSEDPFALPVPGEGPVHYDPVFRPGPLADPNGSRWMQRADTFRSATYDGTYTDGNIVVHRYYGGTARPDGKFWTPGPANGALQDQLGNAINPGWGNTMTQVETRTLPAGTLIYRGPAAPQAVTDPSQAVVLGSLIGGDEQIFIPELPAEWSTAP